MSARSSAKSRVPAVGKDSADHPSAAARALSQIIERGARVQAPAVKAYVERLREHDPEATPAEIVGKLEKHYLAAVMASGAAVGSAAAFPGIGTLVALSAVAGETVVFLEATAVFVLAVAEVYGIPADHRDRRRALVLAVLVGEDSKHAIADLLGTGRTRLERRRRVRMRATFSWQCVSSRFRQLRGAGHSTAQLTRRRSHPRRFGRNVKPAGIAVMKLEPRPKL